MRSYKTAKLFPAFLLFIVFALLLLGVNGIPILSVFVRHFLFRFLAFPHCLQWIEYPFAVQRRQYGRVEDFLEVPLSEGAALYVGEGADTFHQMVRLGLRDRALIVMRQFYEHLDVIAEVTLSADEHDGSLGAVVTYFCQPFFCQIMEGCRRNDTEAQQENVCVWVA